jgi:hypothetical protein
MRILESYLENRLGSIGSCLQAAGRGGSGQPSSEPSGAIQSAATVGICIDRCPVAWRGANVLDLWVKVSEGSVWIDGMTVQDLESTKQFSDAVAWFEADYGRRLKKERGQE